MYVQHSHDLKSHWFSVLLCVCCTLYLIIKITLTPNSNNNKGDYSTAETVNKCTLYRLMVDRSKINRWNNFSVYKCLCNSVCLLICVYVPVRSSCTPARRVIFQFSQVYCCFAVWSWPLLKVVPQFSSLSASAVSVASTSAFWLCYTRESLLVMRLVFSICRTKLDI